MIGIVDYGAGNLASVHNAFERIGEHSEVFEDSKLIDKYDRIVLPGVGSFSKAICAFLQMHTRIKKSNPF